MNFFYSIICFCILTLSACGGGSKAVTQVPPIIVGPQSSAGTLSSAVAASTAASSSVLNSSVVASSSAMSSSSSLTSSASSNPNIQNVFVNSYDPVWTNLSVFEAKYDGVTYREVKDSSSAKLVHWSTVSTAIAGNPADALDLEFLSSTDYDYAQARIFSANSNINLSNYKTGSVEFDLKVITFGNSAVPLKFELECGWPCISKDHSLSTPSVGIWYHQSIALADLIDEGLDLTKINVGFQIYPAWGNQSGFHFQVANIKWVSGGSPTKKYCAEYRASLNNLQLTPILLAGSATPTAISAPIFTALKPGWNSSVDVIGYKLTITPAFKSCVFTTGNQLWTQFNFPYDYMSDGKIKVGYFFEDSNGNRAYFKTSPIQTNLNPAGTGEWQWLVASLNPFSPSNMTVYEKVDSGFDPNLLAYLGFILDANGKDPSVNQQISLDNVLLKQPF